MAGVTSRKRVYKLLNKFSCLKYRETAKFQQKLQQYQALIQKQQMRIKSLTAASANSISRPSPGETAGAEASATQGLLEID